MIGRVNTLIPVQLLFQIGSKREVAARWYEFGRAVGTDKQILEECANCSPEVAITEILKWWVRNRQVTWKHISEVLNNIGLQKLATSILKGSKTTIILFITGLNECFITCYQRSFPWRNVQKFCSNPHLNLLQGCQSEMHQVRQIASCKFVHLGQCDP